MSFYWASFEKHDSGHFRFDTRVYVHDIIDVEKNDVCIGAVVGKNPGSARPMNASLSTIQPIQLSNDKLLPTIRSIVCEAYEFKNKQCSPRAFVQILNLFYLCDADLDSAIARLPQTIFRTCAAEMNHYSWVWYVWGDNDSRLTEMKLRFHKIDTKQHWFYDPSKKMIRCHCPSPDDFAKHTQGLLHDLVVPHLSDLL